MLTTLSQASEYLPLALECRTQNQFNRLHIHLENILSPREFALLADLAKRQQFPERSRNWLEKIGGLSPSLFDSPQAYSRRALSENVLFYQDPERAPATKTLLVGFAGDARRLMLPIAVFLQCLDARAWDLVLLRKGPQKRPFSKGVEGVSRHLPSVLSYVNRLVAARRYRRIVTLGTSGGGFYAIVAAILLDGASGVSIGEPRPHRRSDSGCVGSLPTIGPSRNANRHSSLSIVPITTSTERRRWRCRLRSAEDFARLSA
jgi:hypothetical protein